LEEAFNSTHGVSAVPADDCEQHIAVRDALIQHANKVEAGSYIIDVQKKLIGLKLVLQPIEQTAGVAGIIAAAVVEEYFADHRAYLVDAVTKAKSVTVAPPLAAASGLRASMLMASRIAIETLAKWFQKLTTCTLS
jgi:hypothetical protein